MKLLLAVVALVTPLTMCAAPDVRASSAITLSGPVDLQVVQRDTSNRGDIPIVGTVSSRPDAVEARIVQSGTRQPSAWKNINARFTTTATEAATTTRFTGALADVPAGGWYRLEVRSRGGAGPGSIVRVDKVGVGDVYVTAGQSNAANHGLPRYTPRDDRVVARTGVSGGRWVKAADPQPIATGDRGSAWSRLGDLLVAREHVPIGFVSVGWGGTQLSMWLKGGGSLYDSRLMPVVQSFPAHGFKAILFHQGESDAFLGTPAADYQGQLNQIIADSRADAHWQIPWFVSRAAFTVDIPLTHVLAVTSAQKNVVYANPLVSFGPRTDDFHQQDKVLDGVHFNGSGLADFAAQWSAILGKGTIGRVIDGDLEANAGLADGAIFRVNCAAKDGRTLIGWEPLAISGVDPATGVGYYNPDERSYSKAADRGPTGGIVPGMVGRHVGFIEGTTDTDYVEQTFAGTLPLGAKVSLSAALGRRLSGTPGRAVVQILADGRIIGERSVDGSELAPDTFTTITLDADVPADLPSDAALAIRIRRDGPSTTTTYVDFDAVRLSVTP